MAASDSHYFLKLEDVHSSSSPASSYDAGVQTPGLMQTSPPPVIVHSKQAKKRKSWGQELPEPKTALPPRKRAKTDDEKEQRRIERIKRNRAAAHNSRERKRQETETLAVALARANSELEAYRRLHGPLPASVVLPEVTVSTDSSDTPAPSLVESNGTADVATSPASPADDLDLDHTAIKLEPADGDFVPHLASSSSFDHLDAKSSHLPLLHLTQHSAVSVEQPETRQLGASQSFGGLLVDPTLPLPHDASTPDVLPDHLGGALDPLAFADGAFDASFNPPLDFSFDDFIHDAATVAVPGYGAA